MNGHWVLSLPRWARYTIYSVTNPRVMFVVLMADHGPRRWRPYYSGILLRRFAESVNAIRLSFVGLAAQAERIAVEMDRGGWESKDA